MVVYCKDSVSFWKGVRGMNCNNIPLTTKVGDAVGSKNITQLWQDHFSTLLNNAHNIIFYARTFLLYKNDMRKTWGVINDTLQSNRRSKVYRNLFLVIVSFVIQMKLQIILMTISLISPVHSHNKFSLSIHLITI